MSIETNIDKLNKIQALIFSGHKLDTTEKADWTSNVLAVKNAGYVLKKKAIKNNCGMRVGIKWYAATPRKKNFFATFVNLTMRPNDGLPCCKTDCTTRAMAYVLRGRSSYREIEERQYKKAEEKNKAMGYKWGDKCFKYHRNTVGIWDKVMLESGYLWVKLPRKIRRDKLANLLSMIAHPIISESSGHVAVIDKGSVIDAWDSRRGMCKRILINHNDFYKVMEKIK